MVQRKFDRLHDAYDVCNLLQKSATQQRYTIYPLIMNDDALGDPMSYNANPEHASWVQEEMPNCYPDSEIRNFKLTIDLHVLKALYTTDNVQSFYFDYALIACAFPEDLDAIDELSGLTLKAILELQKETTDRQCYPLFNAVDMSVPSVLHANIPGLT